MFKFLIIVSVFFSFLEVYTQDVPFYLTQNRNEQFEYKNFDLYVKNYKNTKHNQIQSSRIVQRNYDVLEYKIALDWRNPLSSPTDSLADRYYDGNVSILLKFNKTDDKLSLDIGSTLVVNKILIDGKDFTKNYTIDRNNEELKISGLSSLANIPAHAITIDYSYNGNYNDPQRSGLYLYKKGTYNFKKGSTLFYTEENLAYTMSEPQDARLWVICNDNPHDKAMFSSTVTVPEGYTVVSNGLGSFKTNNDKSRTYEYSHKYPLSTYLMNIAASKYAHFSDTFVREQVGLDTTSIVPLNYYVWQADIATSDTSTQILNANKSFQNMTAIMKYFSTVMIPYPFESYGMVAVSPFNYGGMEHQTMTTVSRTWLANTSESGIAHEFGHHWFGDLVTCATWQDLWHNEGGATWTEALWAEKLGGIDSYKYFTNRNGENYLSFNKNLSLPSIAQVTVSELFSTYGWPLVYQKAGFVYHMLRVSLGDSAFFKTLRDYHNNFKYNYIETDDFANFWASKNPNLPFDLKIFIDQFTNKPGHPLYDLTPLINYNTVTSTTEFKLKVSQIQSTLSTAHAGTPETFIGYMDVKIYKDTVIKKFNQYRVLITKKDTILNLPEINYIPKRIEVLHNDFLCDYQVNEAVTAIETEEITDELKINCSFNSKLPNIIIDNLQEGNVEIELMDLNGRIVKSLYSNTCATGSLQFKSNLEDYPNGVYFIVAKNGNRSKIAKVNLVD